MEQFKKIYLGKGKKVTNLRIVRVTVKLDDIKAIAYDYEGTDYASFEIAEMINPDQFGRTHSVYYRKKLKTGTDENEKQSVSIQQTAASESVSQPDPF